MQLSKNLRRAAIIIGIGVAALGGWAYWYLRHRQWCVRAMPISGKAVGGQEVVYSWGCLNPQRFRQWSAIATADRNRYPGFSTSGQSQRTDDATADLSQLSASKLLDQ